MLTIQYYLSAIGQKASLLVGGDGKRQQELKVAKDDPAFAAVLEAARMEADGTALLNLRDAYPTGYAAVSCDRSNPVEADSPTPTAGELLALHMARVTDYDRRLAAKVEALRQKTADALAERRTNETLHREDGGIEWTERRPAWPYDADETVKGSPEAAAWEAELEVANETAKADAAVRVAAYRAEQAANKEAEAKAEEERRAALGLTADDIDLDIEDGALIEVPRGCWESHKRGKNWLASIGADPASPGGLARTFWEKAKGSSYYLVAADVRPGEAVEFGADYYSGGGRKDPTRWYGFVVRVEPERLILRKCAGGKTAIKAGEKYAASLPAAPVHFTSEGGLVIEQE